MSKIPLYSYLDEIEKLLDSHNYTDAVQHCRHILTQYPRHIATYRLLARILFEQGRFSEATDLFLRVLSADPSDFIAHIGLSDIYKEESQLAQSIWHLERAYEVQPYNAAIQTELRQLQELQDEDNAPDQLTLTPGALARLYLRGELYQQAAHELRHVLQQDENRIDLQVLLAETLWRNNHRMEAESVSRSILEKLPNCVTAHAILAEIWLKAGRTDEAKPYLRHLQELAEPDSQHLDIESPIGRVFVAEGATKLPEQVLIDHLDSQKTAVSSAGAEWVKEAAFEDSSALDEAETYDWLEKTQSAPLTEPAGYVEPDLVNMEPEEPRVQTNWFTDQSTLPQEEKVATGLTGWLRDPSEPPPSAEETEFVDDFFANSAVEEPDWLVAAANVETTQVDSQLASEWLSSIHQDEDEFSMETAVSDDEDWLSALSQASDTSANDQLAETELPALSIDDLFGDDDETPEWYLADEPAKPSSKTSPAEPPPAETGSFELETDTPPTFEEDVPDWLLGEPLAEAEPAAQATSDTDEFGSSGLTQLFSEEAVPASAETEEDLPDWLLAAEGMELAPTDEQPEPADEFGSSGLTTLFSAPTEQEMADQPADSNPEVPDWLLGDTLSALEAQPVYPADTLPDDEFGSSGLTGFLSEQPEEEQLPTWLSAEQEEEAMEEPETAEIEEFGSSGLTQFLVDAEPEEELPLWLADQTVPQKSPQAHLAQLEEPEEEPDTFAHMGMTDFLTQSTDEAEDLPPWLSLVDTADSIPNIPSSSQPQLAEFGSTDFLADDGGEVTGWLMNDSLEPQDVWEEAVSDDKRKPTQPADDEQKSLDWLENLAAEQEASVDEELGKLPAEDVLDLGDVGLEGEELPDWLADLSTAGLKPVTDELPPLTDEIPMAELPDWLKPPPSIKLPQTSGLLPPHKLPDDIADWLPPAAQTGADTDLAGLDEDLDWLGEVAQTPQNVTEEAPVLDWLEPSPPPQQPAQELAEWGADAPADELDSVGWLDELVGQGSVLDELPTMVSGQVMPEETAESDFALSDALDLEADAELDFLATPATPETAESIDDAMSWLEELAAQPDAPIEELPTIAQRALPEPEPFDELDLFAQEPDLDFLADLGAEAPTDEWELPEFADTPDEPAIEFADLPPAEPDLTPEFDLFAQDTDDIFAALPTESTQDDLSFLDDISGLDFTAEFPALSETEDEQIPSALLEPADAEFDLDFLADLTDEAPMEEFQLPELPTDVSDFEAEDILGLPAQEAEFSLEFDTLGEAADLDFLGDLGLETSEDLELPELELPPVDFEIEPQAAEPELEFDTFDDDTSLDFLAELDALDDQSGELSLPDVELPQLESPMMEPTFEEGELASSLATDELFEDVSGDMDNTLAWLEQLAAEQEKMEDDFDLPALQPSQTAESVEEFDFLLEAPETAESAQILDFMAEMPPADQLEPATTLPEMAQAEPAPFDMLDDSSDTIEDTMAWLEQLASEQGAPVEDLTIPTEVPATFEAALPEPQPTAVVELEVAPQEIQPARPTAKAKLDDVVITPVTISKPPEEMMFDSGIGMDDAEAWLAQLVADQGINLEEEATTPVSQAQAEPVEVVPPLPEPVSQVEPPKAEPVKPVVEEPPARPSQKAKLDDVVITPVTISKPPEEMMFDSGIGMDDAEAWLAQLVADQGISLEDEPVTLEITAEPEKVAPPPEPIKQPEPPKAEPVKPVVEEPPARPSQKAKLDDVIITPVTISKPPEEMMFDSGIGMDDAEAWLAQLVADQGISLSEEPIVPELEAAEPITAVSAQPTNTLAADLDWLEQLVLQEGVTLPGELTQVAPTRSRQEDLEDALNWLEQQEVETTATPSTSQSPELDLPTDIPENPDELMVWLEHLAARQGAPLEELPSVTDADAEVEIPQWLIGEAAQTIEPPPLPKPEPPAQTVSSHQTPRRGKTAPLPQESFEKEVLPELQQAGIDLGADVEDSLPDWLDLDELPAEGRTGYTGWLRALPETDITSWLEAEEKATTIEPEEITAVSRPATTPKPQTRPLPPLPPEPEEKPLILPQIDFVGSGSLDRSKLDVARQTMRQGNFNEALGHYQGLIATGEGLSTLIADLETASTQNTRQPLIQQMLGEAYFRNGQLQKALDMYREALDQL